MTPHDSEPELNPFEKPPSEEETVEGKVALELIPSMRRWTYYQEKKVRHVSPWRWWLWVVLCGFLLGAALVAVMRLL